MFGVAHHAIQAPKAGHVDRAWEALILGDVDQQTVRLVRQLHMACAGDTLFQQRGRVRSGRRAAGGRQQAAAGLKRRVAKDNGVVPADVAMFSHLHDCTANHFQAETKRDTDMCMGRRNSRVWMHSNSHPYFPP